MNFDTKKKEYAEILKKQSTLIKFCLLKKFLNNNLNFSEDYLLMLNQQAILSINGQHYTGPEIILHEVIDTDAIPNLTTPSAPTGGGMFTNLFGLGN